MFAHFGVRVVIVDVLSILSDAEPDISRALVGYFREEGIVVHEHIRVRRVGQTGQGVMLEVSTENGRDGIGADRLLVTTGRQPNTQGLGLADAGVEQLANGGITVDEYMRTTKPGVVLRMTIEHWRMCCLHGYS